MAPIKQLILSGVEFSASARDIAEAFRINDLATAVKIVKDERYYPTYDHSGRYDLMDKLQTKALVKIEFWEDTEAAYNFIKEIRSKSKALLNHSRGCWLVEEIVEDFPDIRSDIDVRSDIGCASEDEAAVIYWDDCYLDEEKELIRWNPPCCAADWSVENCEYCIDLDAMEMA